MTNATKYVIISTTNKERGNSKCQKSNYVPPPPFTAEIAKMAADEVHRVQQNKVYDEIKNQVVYKIRKAANNGEYSTIIRMTDFDFKSLNHASCINIWGDLKVVYENRGFSVEWEKTQPAAYKISWDSVQ